MTAQGGDVSYVDQPDKMAKAGFIETVMSPVSGYLATVHARLIGEAAVELGAGRAKKGDPIDHAVGFEILHKVGGYVRDGQPLFTEKVPAQAPLERAAVRASVGAT